MHAWPKGCLISACPSHRLDISLEARPWPFMNLMGPSFSTLQELCPRYDRRQVLCDISLDLV